MPEQHRCDFCGRPDTELEIDADGMWVCPTCRAKLTLPPTGETNSDLPDEIRKLVGKNAGAICRTLNLPYRPPYRSIIDAAATIAYDEDRYLSTWTFTAQWPDGTTVWRAHDGESIAVVNPDGTVNIQSA